GSGVGESLRVGEVSEDGSDCGIDISSKSAVGDFGTAGGAGTAARKHEGADQETLVREQRGQARSGLGADAVGVRAGRGTTGAAVQGSASRRSAPVSRSRDGSE